MYEKLYEKNGNSTKWEQIYVCTPLLMYFLKALSNF